MYKIRRREIEIEIMKQREVSGIRNPDENSYRSRIFARTRHYTAKNDVEWQVPYSPLCEAGGYKFSFASSR